MSELNLTINDVEVSNDDEVSFNQTANPKREGSKAHSRFAKYMKSETVESYLAAGGTKGDLKYDWDKGFIDIGEIERDES